MQRYTYYGNTQLENLITGHLDLIRQRVLDTLEGKILAIILSGGYGRGEGAVYYQEDQETVFNDYDLFVVTDKIPWYQLKKHRHQLAAIARELSDEIGIEVDLYLITKKAFARQPFTLMNYEMQKKSITIYGDPRAIELLPAYTQRIPLAEGTRLLLNRGILLLYCKRYFFKHEQIDASQRQIMIKYIIKAILAMGDSYLIAIDRYDYSYLKKAEIFRALPDSDYRLFKDLVENYLLAVEFKLKVDYTLYENTNLPLWLFHTISLFETYLYWYEEKRLGVQIDCWEEYKELIIQSTTTLPTLTKLKNILINIREFGIIKTLRDTELIFSYPRDRLYILLTFALFRYDPEDYKQANMISTQPIEDLDTLVDQFWEIWLKYS